MGLALRNPAFLSRPVSCLEVLEGEESGHHQLCKWISVGFIMLGPGKACEHVCMDMLRVDLFLVMLAGN